MSLRSRGRGFGRARSTVASRSCAGRAGRVSSGSLETVARERSARVPSDVRAQPPNEGRLEVDVRSDAEPVSEGTDVIGEGWDNAYNVAEGHVRYLGEYIERQNAEAEGSGSPHAFVAPATGDSFGTMVKMRGGEYRLVSITRPTSSFLLQSILITGSPPARYSPARALMYSNWALRSGFWAPSATFALACKLYPR